jgi:peptide/nickel transport system permease protein
MATTNQLPLRSPLPTAPVMPGAVNVATQTDRLAVLWRLLRNRKGLVGVIVLVAVCLIGAFGPALAPYDPVEVHIDAQLVSPSPTYWFGTDELGRDVLSRILYGARPSVMAGVVTVALAATVGSLLGLMAGYLAAWFDSIAMSVLDTLLAFPSIFLAIGIVTILGPGWINAVLAIVIVFIPSFARLVRSSTLATAARDFVMAARATGCTRWQIMLRHIFPNCLAPLIVLMAIAAPDAILTEAALSFLGLGSQPPAPSWGNMLSDAQGYLARSLSYALFPGMVITIVVFGMNFFADGLQDAIDPRRIRAMKRSQVL